MQVSKPDWFDKWVITDVDNWHLKENAPVEVKKEFEEIMEFINEEFNEDEKEEWKILNCCPKDCKDRQTYCHINCKEYKIFQKENEIKRKNEREYQKNMSDYINMLYKENKRHKN